MNDDLLGKCGFWCGACPTFLGGGCTGCVRGQREGDCFTRDCVIRRELPFCGACPDFPCETILTREKTTILDQAWLRWKKEIAAREEPLPTASREGHNDI